MVEQRRRPGKHAQSEPPRLDGRRLHRCRRPCLTTGRLHSSHTVTRHSRRRSPKSTAPAVALDQRQKRMAPGGTTGDDDDVESANGTDGLRARFEANLRDVQGRTITAVDYWDTHNFGAEPAPWDYGNWHHAVMGVQLTTGGGPVAVTWTSTFFPYGVEVARPDRRPPGHGRGWPTTSRPGRQEQPVGPALGIAGSRHGVSVGTHRAGTDPAG